jgi:hypothetical protein
LNQITPDVINDTNVLNVHDDQSNMRMLLSRGQHVIKSADHILTAHDSQDDEIVAVTW